MPEPLPERTLTSVVTVWINPFQHKEGVDPLF